MPRHFLEVLGGVGRCGALGGFFLERSATNSQCERGLPPPSSQPMRHGVLRTTCSRKQHILPIELGRPIRKQFCSPSSKWCCKPRRFRECASRDFGPRCLPFAVWNTAPRRTPYKTFERQLWSLQSKPLHPSRTEGSGNAQGRPS